MVIDFRNIFESSPHSHLLLAPDLTIIGGSDSYFIATHTDRELIMGKDLFEVFPDNPNDPTAKGESIIRASLKRVLANKVPDVVGTIQYDIRRTDGTFEKRYWMPTNTPVLNDKGDIIYIIHRVGDVTELEQIKKETEEQLARKNELEELQSIHARHLQESEERFQQIFNLSPVAIYITNFKTGAFMHINNAFEKLLLYKREDIIGKTSVELMITNDKIRSEIQKQIKDNGGRIAELELELRIGNGEARNMLISSELIEIQGQECFLAVMVDISKRKEIEDSLQDTNTFLDTILDNIPDMVFVKDAKDLKFIRFNKAGEEILGQKREDLIGKNDYDFFTVEQADYFTEKDSDVFRNRKQMDIEEEPIQTKNGQRWLHTKKIPVFENDKPVYLLGISEDITERKKHQDAILQLNKELEAFTYSVSHDLRAPLRAVNGYSRMLEEDYGTVLDDEGKRLLNRISANAEKMGKLIDELLAFSRLGRKELRTTDTDMNELVHEVVSEINRTMDHKSSITIHNLPVIQADSMLISQVLMNLICNAVKYSAKKDKPTIDISAKQENSMAVFIIKDNGAGFDMRYVDKLFGVFQRLHATDEFEGTGVGLAIVQRIIDKHGGKVWAEAKVDEGATFYFSIPN